MKPQEARAFVAALVAAFPSRTVEQATVDMYATQIGKFQNVEAAKRAVEALVNTSEWFPSLASFREEYGRQAKRIHDDRESERRRLADERGLAEGDRPPIPDIVHDFIRSLGGTEKDPTPEQRVEAELEEVAPGRCDDCSEDDVHASRFVYGKVTVCRPCAASRMRVRMQTENPRVRVKQLTSGGPVALPARGSGKQAPNERYFERTEWRTA